MSASNQLVNYLACLAVTTPTGTVWGVVHAQSTTGQNPVITPLWVDASPNQPLTRDCAMVTNGQNSLSVYLDHVARLSSRIDLNLNMPAPYSFFVEEETQVASSLLYGNYQDFYATLGRHHHGVGTAIDRTQRGPRWASGNRIATAPVVSGSGRSQRRTYKFPLQAYIDAYSTRPVSPTAPWSPPRPLRRLSTEGTSTPSAVLHTLPSRSACRRRT